MRFVTRNEFDEAIKQTRQDLLLLESEIGRESFLRIFEEYNSAEDDCPPSNLVWSLFDDYYSPNYSFDQRNAHSLAEDYILSVWEQHNTVAKMTKPRKWTLQNQWRNFRKSIFERDNYKCQECGTNKHLCAHHIKGRSEYPELSYDPSNVITLCKYCHAKAHPDKASLILSRGRK